MAVSLSKTYYRNTMWWSVCSVMHGKGLPLATSQRKELATACRTHRGGYRSVTGSRVVSVVNDEK